MDKIRPLKIETVVQGSQDDNGYPTEINPDEDYMSCKGISFENSDTHTLDLEPDLREVRLTDEYNGVKLLSDLQLQNKFEFDINEDITLDDGIDFIFENDGNNDMMPSLSGTKDRFFEVVSDEIVPKV